MPNIHLPLQEGDSLMKKIQKYILKSERIFVGLEDSLKSWKICVRSNRRIVHETTMEAKIAVLLQYFKNKFPNCKITVMYEAGFKGFNLYDSLVGAGHSCVVTPPHTVTEEKCNRVKNDRVDCRRLSKNLENEDYKTCFVPDKELREDRQITRLADQLLKNIVATKNRIRRALEFHGLEHHFPTGKWGDKQYQKAEQKLQQLNLSYSLDFSFSNLFLLLSYLRKQRALVLKKLKELRNKSRYKESFKILFSCPGIGVLTAIRLVLEWGNLKRFINRSSFSKFTGLSPSDYSTGDTDRKGHITRQGSGRIRKWLIESAWVAIRRDPVLFDKYNRVWRASGSSKKAIVAVARKLALRVRYLLLTGETYCLAVIE
jgi:transposase